MPPILHGPIIVRPAMDKDRKQLANLIHFEIYVHRHLDWRVPLDWIGHAPCLVAEHNGDLLATLVCPPDPPEVAWIRLFAVSSHWEVNSAWKELWPGILDELSDSSLITAIPLHQWFCHLLEKNHFENTNTIEVLIWDFNKPIPPPSTKLVSIRPMSISDLPAVYEIDSLAFNVPWQISTNSLRLAFQQAILATVAEDEQGLLGYQISTASPMGSHLARLAVRPDSQRHGIGYTLVRDIIEQFSRRSASRITVNTQTDNLASLALYQKAGFHKTGDTYPVYQYMHK